MDDPIVQQNPTPQKRAERVWERAFLTALAKTGNVTRAAKAAKIDRSVVYELRNEAEDFAKAWDAAMEEAADLLEAEARRRAEKGVLEPVFYQGKKVGTIRRYSDTLLIFLLKGAKPDKYRERHEHSGPDGGPIPHAATVTVYIPDNGREDRAGNGDGQENR